MFLIRNLLILITIITIFSCTNSSTNIYWKSGVLKEYRKYKNETDTSEYYCEKYYISGKIEEKGYIKENVKDGQWISFFENGKIKKKENYDLGKLNGLSIEYYENGKLKCNQNFDFDNPIKKWIYLDSIGNVLEEGYYEQGGIKVGTWFINENDIKEEISYDNNGSILKSIKTDLIKNETSILFFYSGGGGFKAEGWLKNNNLDSIWIKYYSNGQIKLKGKFRCGSIDDYIFEDYLCDEDETLFNYVNSCKVGIFEYWYSNGIKRAQTLCNDSLELINEYWNASGIQIVKNGEGKVIVAFDENRNKVLIFKNGKVIKQYYSKLKV
ncbi:MAG: hypothetical protein A2033_01210 [Bacteroidetes bacterium GWA2_31_9]|nr:MAG: hypothetical protein A2033_01210 [Bacteroidetes bacterium GWA2_31_9]